ncbi:MAG: cadmium-translocating P-type ATPase [Alistipes sp.]|nr:cadmium-translocating P-type ATPase [Alistipes sp.]
MEKTYEIKNLGCAHCGGKIEEAINRLDEVEKAVLNFPMRKIKISGELSDELLEKINELAGKIEAGVEIVPVGAKGSEHHHEHRHTEKTYEVKNLGCAHCGGKIEEAINRLDEVEKAVLNFPMRKIKISGELSDELLEKINELAGKIEAGVEIVPMGAAGHEHHEHKQEHGHCHDEDCHCGDHEHHEHCHDDHCGCHEHDHHSHERSDSSKMPLFMLIAGVLLFAGALIVQHTVHIFPVYLALYIAAYLLMGYNVLIATVKNVSKGNIFDENFLMTIATIGAFILGEYAEAVGVVLFFRIGELFEDFAVSRSRKAITDIASLRVDEADVLRNGEFVRMDADRIEIGDIIRIKAGERIAADGIVESGESRIDTSAVNGEPVPVRIQPGDCVMSGCINLAETVTLRATAAAADSMISKIAQAVEDATAEKPQIDRFITRFSRIYTPLVIAAALLTAVLGSLITHDPSKWIYSALTFLVISCPCALVLSVPLAYFSGIGAASKLGILFKGGNAIEALAKVKSVIFDKTGTLTNGSFSVTDIALCGDMDEAELLRICGSCESVSSHPVAKSIADYCNSRNIVISEPERSGEAAGRGVYAVLEGREIFCGSEKMMTEKNISMPKLPKTSTGSVVFVAVDGKVHGRIVVSDSVKATSGAAIAELRAMGIHTAMLTGDKPENAEAVGKQLGLDTVRGGLMPDDKLAELNNIRQEKGSVMFVGDGINDAPVLAGADIGGAMQTGADLALEAADAVFMSSEPESVVSAKKIADKTLRISYENIIFALAIKAVVLILGLLGHPNMWLAVFADSGTAMLLILNSVRALNTKSQKKS